MLRIKYGSVYDAAFFAGQVEQSLQSARVVARVICKLFGPRSVVDVGCGLGAWLLAFKEINVSHVCGIDGVYVNPERLLVPRQSFVFRDLNRPFDISGHYDLAMSLEVAEHLSAAAGERLVNALSQAAPLVLFSAAVPGQGGSHHVNEQWPSYWRSLFAAKGFRLFDPIRPLIRGESSVRWWYRQNLMIFASPEGIAAHPALGQEVPAGEELEWVYVSLVKKSHDLRAMLRKLPCVPWTWSYLKPWIRTRAQQT